MKKLTLAIFITCFIVKAFAQTPISLPAASPYSENFNTTPGTSGTSYPAGWTAYNKGSQDATMAVGGPTSTTGDNYNYGSCIGVLGSGTNFDPSTIVFAISNTLGKQDFKISYNIKKIREQGRSNTFSLQVGTASATGAFTSVTGGDYVTGTITEGTVTAYTNVSIPGINNLSGTVYIRFTYDPVGGSGSRDGVALDDVVLSWSSLGPSVISPLATQIGSISARLGANVSNDGGNAITSRGIVWSTSGTPTVGQPGSTRVNVPGTTGIFDTLINGLPAATQIFYRGFAINASGTTYTDLASFYTFSNQPGAVTNLTATGISNHDIRVDWTPVAGANGYLVLQKVYTPPAVFPTDGTAYKEGDWLGDVEIIDTVLDPMRSTSTSSGLISGTVYQYSVIPYGFNGINIQTINYNTDAVVPVAFDTTSGVGPSALSDLVGIAQSGDLTIASIQNGTLNSNTEGVKLWQLALRDGGNSLNDADDMPTSITRLVITKGRKNSVVNWLNTFRFAALFDDSTGQKVADATLYRDSLVFTNISFVAADNNMKTLTLRATLKPTNVRDQDTLHFAVMRNKITTPGLTASSQIPVLDIESDTNRTIITVTATKIVFTLQPPVSLGINTFMSPNITALLTDANGNTDLYTPFVFTLSGDKIPLLYPRTAIPVSGVLTFDSIFFNRLAIENRLKIGGGNADTAVSDPFNILGSSSSDIVATAGFMYTDSIAYLNFQSNTLTAQNSVAVFGFTLRDGGASLPDGDAFGTTLKRITFNLTGELYTRRVAIFNGTVKIAEAAVNGTGLTFDNLNMTAPDNDSLNLVLRATFNSRNANGKRISFAIAQAVADTGQGSVFGTINAGGASSSLANANNILKYVKQYVSLPTLVQQMDVCKGSQVKVMAAAPAAGSIRWYTNLNDVLPFFTGDTLTISTANTTATYYAAFDSLGWLSEKVAVQVIVHAVAAPSVQALSVCRGTDAQLQAVSAHPVKWYRNSSTTDVMTTGNMLNALHILRDTVFFVQADSAGCLSNRAEAVVKIKAVTAPVTNDTNVCSNASFTLAASSVHTINWYTANGTLARSGNTFALSNLVTDTFFYAESDSSGCKSEQVKVSVHVQQVNAPQPASTYRICAGTQATLSALNSNRQINWYDSPSATTPVSTNPDYTTPALNTTASYYMQAVEQQCTSARIEVKVWVNALPADPVISINDSVCSGNAAIITVISADTVKWYDDLLNGNLLHTGNTFTSPFLSAATSYYAQARANGCSSALVPVAVTIKARPANPTVQANVNACSGKALTLKANAAQGIIKWFANLTDTTSIASDSLITGILLNDTRYYAATLRNGCLSNRQVVNVKVNPTPAAAFSVNDDEQCLGGNQFVFLLGGIETGTQYQWNFGDTSFISFSNPVKSYTAKGQYSVKLKATSSTGCFSETSKTVTVTAPDVDFTFDVVGSTVTFNTASTGIASYKWHFTANDSSNAQAPVFTFAQNGIYNVTLNITDVNGCVASVSKQVNITKTGLSGVFDQLHKLSVYPNPFKESVNLDYVTAKQTSVRISLFGLNGQLIEEVLNGQQAAGMHQVPVNLGRYSKQAYLLKVEIDGLYKIIKLTPQ